MQGKEQWERERRCKAGDKWAKCEERAKVSPGFTSKGVSVARTTDPTRSRAPCTGSEAGRRVGGCNCQELGAVFVCVDHC